MDEEIEIPTHFMCPISLQLMRDPVIVSTGITYDRESIENWLFSWKNNTCPVTKQPLNNNNNNNNDDDVDDVTSTSSLTPNHTLRRLIQAWCTLNAVERIPTPKPPVDETHVANLLRDLKTTTKTLNDNDLIKTLHRLKSIATHGGERAKKCLDSAGVVECLASTVLNRTDSAATDAAVEILFHLRATSEDRLKSLLTNDPEIVDSLVNALRHGSTHQSRSRSVVLLRSVLRSADPTRLAALSPRLFAEVVSVLVGEVNSHHSSTTTTTTKAALKLLAETTPWGRNRIKAVEGGAVSALVEALLAPAAAPAAAGKRVCEVALAVMEQLCGCAEGRAELARHPAGVAVVAKKILRVSHVASDRAVRVLGSVCRYSGTGKVLREMLEVGAVAKLCLLVQVDTGFKTKNRALDILKLHSNAWKHSPCIPKHLFSSYPS